MSRLTMLVGVALAILGIVAYVVTGGSSLTALIPTLFGIIYIALGYFGEHSEHLRKHMMHVAAALSLIGIIANATAVPAFISYAFGDQIPRPAATVSRFLMLLICLVHLIAAIRSFAMARLKPTTT